MAYDRTTATLALALSSLCLVSACGADANDVRDRDSRGSAAAKPLPGSYRYILRSSCGERPMLGTFRLKVRAGQVISARPVGETHLGTLTTQDFPSVEELTAKWADAEPPAVVEAVWDRSGVLASLSIDPFPEAEDDEECYRVSDLTRLP